MAPYIICDVPYQNQFYVANYKKKVLVSGVCRASAQVSNAPKIINISQLFRKSSIKQELKT